MNQIRDFSILRSLKDNVHIRNLTIDCHNCFNLNKIGFLDILVNKTEFHSLSLDFSGSKIEKLDEELKLLSQLNSLTTLILVF